MSISALDSGLRVYATATHATAAVATIAGVAGQRIYITDIIASSDKAGSIMLVLDGATTIFQVQVGVGNFSHHFETPLVATVGASAAVSIDGTAACKANINGIQL